MALNDRYTKHLVVSDSATVNPSQMAENVILVNSAGQKISTKTDAELNSRFVSGFFPEFYGAKGDGSTDDTAPIQAAIDAAEAAGGGDVVLSARSGYKTSAAIVVKKRIRLLGTSYQTKIICTNAGDDGIKVNATAVGATWGRWAVKNIEVAGEFAIGVNVSAAPISSGGATNGEMDNVWVSGTGINGFRFANTYHSTFANLSCNAATISNACFEILGTVNGVQFDNLYTGSTSGHLYSVYINNVGTIPGGSDLTAGLGLQFNSPVCQGGKYGFYILNASGVVIHNPYFENVANNMVIGGGGRFPSVNSLVVNGGTWAGCSASNPYYANRGPSIRLSECRNVKFQSVVVATPGLVSCPVTGGGGGYAEVKMLLNIDGSVAGYVVASPGRGYTGTPTITPPAPASGTADTITPVLSGQRLVGLTITPGSSPNYAGAYLALYPVGVLYGTGTYKVMFDSCAGGVGTDLVPFHTMIGRDPTASTNNGVTIVGDIGSERQTFTTTKTEGAGHQIAVVSDDAAGARVMFLRAVPQITPPA